MLDLSSKIFNWIQIIFHQNQKTKMAIILNRLRKILTGHYWEILRKFYFKLLACGHLIIDRHLSAI